MPPTPDHQYTYRLELMELDAHLATFCYLDAPAPTIDDTRLMLNRPSWDALGKPFQVSVVITAGEPLTSGGKPAPWDA